ncbi:MAG: hypothetical protein O3B01_13290 [Planctomycetota bacterium]|nr:hypothetical protein [Planctomycetota bacterium]
MSFYTTRADPRSERSKMKLQVTQLRALFVALALCFTQTRWICSQEQMAPDDLAATLIKQVEAGEATTNTIKQLESWGMAAAAAGARHLDEERPRTNRILFRLISRVGLARQAPRQMLQLYDPEANKVFYSESAAEMQRQIAVCLSWKSLPSEAYEALVKAAPVPLLGWLLEEAKSETPRHDQIRKTLGYWGWWVKVGYERQFKEKLQEAAGVLSSNPEVIRDPTTFTALLQFVEEISVPDSSGLILKGLSHELPEVRLSAVLAIKDDLSPEGRAMYLKALETEPKPSVQVSLARSAANFPTDNEVGSAVARLYDRSNDMQVRSAVLQSLNRVQWPECEALILKALDDSSQEIRQSAIQAIPEKAGIAVSSKCLSLAKDADRPDPYLTDALGRLKTQEAVSLLARWLGDESALVRVRTVLALENIGGAAAQGALLKQLMNERQEIVLSQLVRICSRLSLPGAEARLAELCTDTRQKFHLRIEAFWSMAAYDRPDVRNFLREKKKALQSFEEDSDHAPDAIADRSDQSEAFLVMSLFRLNEPDSPEEVLRVFDASTPGTKVSMLFMLTELKRDHPIIGKALLSSDYAVLRGGVAAALEANPSIYRARLKELSENPTLQSILASGLETLGLKKLLDESPEAGKGEHP